MKLLTDAAIQRLKIKDKRYHVTEGGGLYVVIYPRGHKTFASYYTGNDGKRRWHKLGSYPLLTLEEAREKNRELQKLAEKGFDPKNMADGLTLDPTLQEVFDLFMRKGVDRTGKALRPKTLKEYTQAFEADILPALGKRKVRDLRKRDILPVLEVIEQRGAHNQANQVYRRLRRVLSFAAARDIIEVSPMGSMEPVGRVRKRNRILNSEEIKTLLEWSDDSETARILKLILITGARPGEVAGMQKEEINGHWWTIPQERVKTDIPHRVYLTDLARRYLTDNGFNITNNSVAKALRRARTGKELSKDKPPTLPIKDSFVPHDLRRTMATGLAALGFSDEVINAVQGRAKLGIIGTYNLHTYDVERQKAAEAWERKLMAITDGINTDNVVAIRTA